MDDGIEQRQRSTSLLLVESDADYAGQLLAMLQTEADDQGQLLRSWRADSLAQLDRGIIPDDVDVVLASLELVDSSGLRTYDEIAARYPTTPIIVIADGQDDEAIQAVAFGAVAGVRKGSEDHAPLLTTVRQAVIRHRTSLDVQEWQVRHEEHHRLATVGKLIGGLATEYNQANSIIMGFTDRLLQQDLAEEQERDLRRIRAAAQQSADLTGHLQALARPTSCERRRVVLAEVINRAMLLIRGELEREGVKLGVVLYQKPLLIEGDANQLAQALVHLLINAQHAMRSSLDKLLEIDLSPSRDGDSALVTIRDTGCGMQPAVLERAFEPFFSTKGVHARSSEDAELPGIGLGLAITEATITGHDGDIEISSSPGLGTTVRISLPLLLPGGDSTPARGQVQLPADDLRDKTFLVVHQDPDLRELLAGALETAGAQVLPAVDAHKAFAALHQFRVHGIITGLQLSGMTVASFLASLRERLPSLPPVVVLGEQDSRESQLLPRLGTVELLTGSWDRKAVQQAMRRALASRAAEK